MQSKKADKRSKIKAARRELFMLTDPEIDPYWHENPVKIKRRDELLELMNVEAAGPTPCDKWQRYFDKRPGLEDLVVELLRSNATSNEIFAAVGVNIQRPLAHLRRKYGFVTRNQRSN